MHNYYFKINVRGRGRFPLDQLRRFEMFPINIESVQNIETSIEHPGFARDYTLGMYASSLSADGPCSDRFRSFGFITETLEIWKDDELFEQNGEVVALAVEREEKLKLSGGINWEQRS